MSAALSASIEQIVDDEVMRLIGRAVYLHQHPEDLDPYEEPPSTVELRHTRGSLRDRLQIVLGRPTDAELDANVAALMALFVPRVVAAYGLLDNQWRDG